MALATQARAYAGHYLVRLDALQGAAADAAFEKLKAAACDFYRADEAVNGPDPTIGLMAAGIKGMDELLGECTPENPCSHCSKCRPDDPHSWGELTAKAIAGAVGLSALSTEVPGWSPPPERE